ncbi:hypothetical protein GGR54DRAFT_102783 [Hypoxylon sp. NC1633]|nr:hypothetical protein GGR54DRAFT_102783 [Hypoxylon sp. NC1633]
MAESQPKQVEADPSQSHDQQAPSQPRDQQVPSQLRPQQAPSWSVGTDCLLMQAVVEFGSDWDRVGEKLNKGAMECAARWGELAPSLDQIWHARDKTGPNSSSDDGANNNTTGNQAADTPLDGSDERMQTTAAWIVAQARSPARSPVPSPVLPLSPPPQTPSSPPQSPVWPSLMSYVAANPTGSDDSSDLEFEDDHGRNHVSSPSATVPPIPIPGAVPRYRHSQPRPTSPNQQRRQPRPLYMGNRAHLRPRSPSSAGQSGSA